MVPQDSFLFSGDILSNLYYGSPNDGEEYELNEKVLEISKFLGLHNFIESMPDGYNTNLLENASNLSVGQRQLIAFARVLMLDPKILVLDEATSSVDPYTETLIQDALNIARKGRTTIIIAHRLSTIKNAGLIVVLDNGEIVERGNHEELMSKNGKYAQLVEMQGREIEYNETADNKTYIEDEFIEAKENNVEDFVDLLDKQFEKWKDKDKLEKS